MSWRSLRGGLLLGFAAGALAAVAGGASAQASPALAEPSDGSRLCLVAPDRAIEYPRGRAEQKRGAVIRVRLKFAAPDESPDASFFFKSTDDEAFTRAVMERVRAYRMPCLQRGETRVASQEFQFIPGDGRKVLTSDVRETRAETRTLDCVTGMQEPMFFPRGSRVAHGRVLARFKFTAAEAPPEVAIVFNGGDERFADVVRRHLAGYRMTCLGATDPPLTAQQTFGFRLEGEPATVLQDTTLEKFVRSIDGIEKQRVRFDFTTMGCPFEVHLTLWQPHAKNSVGELERFDPNRREFVEWLRNVDVNVPKRVHDEIVGDSMNIAVPCGILDLL